MADYESLGNGVYCVDAFHVRPRLASIYLLVRDGEVAVIDTGTRYSVPNLLATLDELAIERSSIRYVIPTHAHLDHAGGAGVMMQAFGQAQLIAHPRAARHLIDPSKLVAGSIGVYGERAFAELYGTIEPIDEARVVIAEDGDRHDLGGAALRFIDTPGHARHHFCIFAADSGDLFTGDTFGICYDEMKPLPRGLLPTSSPVQFDPGALHDSIERLLALAPRRLLITHFGAIDDPAARAAPFRDWIDRYVELCEQVRPRDAAGDRELQRRLEADVREAAGDAIDPARLHAVLDMDLRLNADGLGIWWRNRHRE